MYLHFGTYHSGSVQGITYTSDDTIVYVGADCNTMFWLVKDNSKRKQKGWYGSFKQIDSK